MINFYTLFNRNELNSHSVYNDMIDTIKKMNSSLDYSTGIHIIKRDPYYAALYAIFIMKQRWLEAEPVIMTNALYAHSYALRVIGGRWPEAEPTIMQHPQNAYYYATQVIRGRWEEAEPYIVKREKQWMLYTKFLDDLAAGKKSYSKPELSGTSIALPCTVPDKIKV